MRFATSADSTSGGKQAFAAFENAPPFSTKADLARKRVNSGKYTYEEERDQEKEQEVENEREIDRDIDRDPGLSH